MELGQLISTLRKQKGFKQKELAEKSNIPVTVLSKIENGKLKAGMGHLEKIANTLEIPVQILMFLSLEESDIPKHKRNEFTEVLNEFKNTIKGVFINPTLA